MDFSGPVLDMWDLGPKKINRIAGGDGVGECWENEVSLFKGSGDKRRKRVFGSIVLKQRMSHFRR